MADSTQQQARPPEEIRHDIDQTREELGETVEALAHKADVKAQARAKVDDAKVRVAHKRAQTAAMARENAVPLSIAGAALGGLVVGWLIARR